MEFIETLNLYPSRDGVSLAIAKLTCSVESPLHQLPIMFSSWVWAEPQSAWWRNQKHQFLHGGATKKRWNVKKLSQAQPWQTQRHHVEIKRYGWVVRRTTFVLCRRLWPRKSALSQLQRHFTFHSFSAKGWKRVASHESWNFIYTAPVTTKVSARLTEIQSLTPPSRWRSKFSRGTFHMSRR